MEEVLAVPVIAGEKSPGERFPGADNTFTLEAMMQDRKAIQSCTSHYLGQNFAKGSNIKFSNKEGEVQYAYTTSWGMSTRVIGGMIMCHGDDDGLRIPPRVAPKHIVIIPIIPKPELAEAILAQADKLANELKAIFYYGRNIVVHIDKRDRRGGEKNWEWIKKGIPLRIEIGPRDLESGTVAIARRDRPHKDKSNLPLNTFVEQAPKILDEIQASYFAQAKAFQEEHIHTDIQTLDALKAFFTPQNSDKPEIHGGFVLAKWCGDQDTEKLLDDLKVTIRCLPLKQSQTEGKCILTGKKASLDAI
jgi:prolyl-tRNA synthetase